MKIKVCGMKNPQNIEALAAIQPDFMGMIFYPPSTRNAVGLPAGALGNIAANTKKVGVFVNPTLSEVLEKSTEYQLDFAQLHGQESPGFVASVAGFLPVIKAFPISDAASLEKTAAYEGQCEYFLFDTAGKQPGGNGIPFDWNLLQQYKGNTPFLLAGGISPENIEQIAHFQHPKLAGIDLNSRFETEPGIKDIALLKSTLQKIRTIA